MKTWGLLGVGIILGLIAGLIYTWVIAPPEYYDTVPPHMHEYFREDWIRMTALAFGVDHNLERAKLRFQGLDEDEIRQGIIQTLDDAIEKGRPFLLLQRLSELAQIYGANTPAVAIYAPTTPEKPAETQPLPTATFTPPAYAAPVTPTPTATPFILPSPTPQFVSPYTIISQTLTCTAKPAIGLSLVTSQTVRVRGREQVEYLPLPGHAVWLLWEDGADHATTGFKPEQGLGYADFEITPEHTYKLYIDSPTGSPISTLQVSPCSPEEGDGWVTRVFTVLLEIDVETAAEVETEVDVEEVEAETGTEVPEGESEVDEEKSPESP